MAEDLKPDTWLVDDFSLDDRKAEPKWMVYTADDYGVTEVIALCYEKQRAEEIAALRAEVERLNREVRRWTTDEHALGEAYLRLRRKLNAFDTAHAPSGAQVWDHTEKKLEELLARERRYLEALEKIAAPLEVSGDPSAVAYQMMMKWMQKMAADALSPASGFQEPVYGPAGVCPEHGVMKERCKCHQEAEAKGCVCSGGAVVHRTDGPCYHAKSGDYIPKEMMK